MGVMSCSRKNCDNIMCSTYIDDIGYVCYECKLEFEDYITNTYGEDAEFTKGELRKIFKIFMRSEKGDFDGEKITIKDFFGD